MGVGSKVTEIFDLNTKIGVGNSQVDKILSKITVKI